MPIRTMTHADLPRVNRICMAAFMASVAPTLSPQGIDSFTRIAAIESFQARMAGDNLMRVYLDDDSLIGIAELKAGQHLAMLFVDPAHHRRGIGRQLVADILQYARSATVSVSASLGSVPAYLQYGFQCNGDIAESTGLIYQPMTITPLPPAAAGIDDHGALAARSPG